jgi:hypothetical protein
MKLCHIQDFYELCGGRDKLEGITTRQVCRKFVKPRTESCLSSYCEILDKQHHPAVGIATVFISHYWDHLFLDLVEALQYHFRDQPDVIIWLDLFSKYLGIKLTNHLMPIMLDELFTQKFEEKK